LTRICDGLDNARHQKNVQRTMLKQIQKIYAWVQALNDNNEGTGTACLPSRGVIRRVPNQRIYVMDCMCWGFWKRTGNGSLCTEMLPIQEVVGDTTGGGIIPGPTRLESDDWWFNRRSFIFIDNMPKMVKWQMIIFRVRKKLKHGGAGWYRIAVDT
jgi:hypothetical protein